MLRKIILIAIFAIIPFCLQAQDKQVKEKVSKFGFTSGIIESRFDLANVGQIKEIYNPGEQEGFGAFLGFTFDHMFTKDLGLNSEVLWARLDNTDRYLLSTSMKYCLFQSDLHAVGGLELNYLGSAPKNLEGEENINRAGLNILLGLEYQINYRISVFGNISFETTNRLKGDDGKSNHGYQNGRLGIKFKF